MNKNFLAASLLLAVSFAAHADEAAPPPVGWSGTGEAGLAIASGNTKSQNANAKLNVKFNDDQWKDEFYLLAQRNKNNVTTKQFLATAESLPLCKDCKDENAVINAADTLIKMGAVKRDFVKGKYLWSLVKVPVGERS